MSSKKKILIIEDEPHIVLGLTDALEFEGFSVVSANTGKEGVILFRHERPNAVLLDLMLPDTNGFQVCTDLRRWDAFVPIIILTARGQELDKIRGLDAGADDYVTKPFSVGELIARMRAIFRRTTRTIETVPETFTVGLAKVNMTTHTITRGARESPLSFYEVELLRLLYERLGQPVSRDECLLKVWGIEGNATNRTVDNFIVKLRKKIEKSPENPRHILTVYGHGYKLAL